MSIPNPAIEGTLARASDYRKALSIFSEPHSRRRAGVECAVRAACHDVNPTAAHRRTRHPRGWPDTPGSHSGGGHDGLLSPDALTPCKSAAAAAAARDAPPGIAQGKAPEVPFP